MPMADDPIELHDVITSMCSSGIVRTCCFGGGGQHCILSLFSEKIIDCKPLVANDALFDLVTRTIRTIPFDV
jgi:hypothetical protein